MSPSPTEQQQLYLTRTSLAMKLSGPMQYGVDFSIETGFAYGCRSKLGCCIATELGWSAGESPVRTQCVLLILEEDGNY